MIHVSNRAFAEVVPPIANPIRASTCPTPPTSRNSDGDKRLVFDASQERDKDRGAQLREEFRYDGG